MAVVFHRARDRDAALGQQGDGDPAVCLLAGLASEEWEITYPK